MPAVFGYWPIRGLGQPIRLLLRYTGEDYTEKNYYQGGAPDYSEADWYKEKFDLGLPFPNLPYYIDGDLKITQSIAILRHVARKHGLMPVTDEETVRADIVINESMDFIMSTIAMAYCRGYPRDQHKQKREEYVRKMPVKLKQFSDFLGERPYLAGPKITFVDFFVYETLYQQKIIQSDCLDGFPNLVNFLARFEQIPKIKAYMELPDYLHEPVYAKNSEIAAWKD